MPIDPQSFRNALGRFASGITVVTGIMPSGAKVGLTVSAFASLSLEPPLILVCLDRATGCLDAFTDGERFAVNILASDQDAVSTLFAGPANPFTSAGVPYRESEAGVPLLDGCLANLECRHRQVMEGGDHIVLTGLVEHAEIAADRVPLIYYRGDYGDFRPRAG